MGLLELLLIFIPEFLRLFRNFNNWNLLWNVRLRRLFDNWLINNWCCLWNPCLKLRLINFLCIFSWLNSLRCCYTHFFSLMDPEFQFSFSFLHRLYTRRSFNILRSCLWLWLNGWWFKIHSTVFEVNWTRRWINYYWRCLAYDQGLSLPILQFSKAMTYWRMWSIVFHFFFTF